MLPGRSRGFAGVAVMTWLPLMSALPPAGRGVCCGAVEPAGNVRVVSFRKPH